MTVRPIVRFPDPRLREIASPISDFDDQLNDLIQDLTDTLDSVSAIGITGPHIGVSRRAVVLRMEPGGSAKAYINPRIIWASDEIEKHIEGSISMPGVREEMVRSSRVRVAYLTIEGSEEIEEASGFTAACHLHEIDQLDGIFWIQRLSALKRDMLVKKFRKLGR
jgi:peptide deformylase